MVDEVGDEVVLEDGAHVVWLDLKEVGDGLLCEDDVFDACAEGLYEQDESVYPTLIQAETQPVASMNIRECLRS
jgi:hypothetical protein